ncbi:hypothetical protein L6452_36458 [Arctium lappa]|uniref:Uncharacterized protein n=1 Tax=Arctium lappa TaxID=4217 RepID=A0ACB8Y9C0_ARCLA|nr:hypothetical protein L6452_36458 [Arctium lappa]
MDHPNFFLILSFLLTCFYALTVFRRRSSRLPPGPFPFPFIGNLLQVNPDKPHRSLATLSKRYGPLMSLKLGSKTTIVISSPSVAKEFFLTHDMSFSSRTLPDTARVVDRDKYSIVWLSVGDQWRRQRRLYKEYLYSAQRLEANELLLGKKVQELLDHVNQCCIHEKPVNINTLIFTTALNFISNLVCSMDFAQYGSVSSHEFKEAICGVLEISGKPNIADFFPILKLLDPQGLVRHGNACGKKLMNILDQIIDQRLHTRSSSSSCDGVSLKNNDILDSLLDLNLNGESKTFNRDDMKHWLLDLFLGGTDTTSTTLEWAMAELIRNPQKMETARLEFDWKLEGNKKAPDMEMGEKFGITLPRSVPLMAIPIKV